jgi:hypothetical protein
MLKRQTDERAEGEEPWETRRDSTVPLEEELKVDGHGDPLPVDEYCAGWGACASTEAPSEGRVGERPSLLSVLSDEEVKGFMSGDPIEVETRYVEFQEWIRKRVRMQVMDAVLLRVFGSACREGLKDLQGAVVGAIQRATSARDASGGAGQGKG